MLLARALAQDTPVVLLDEPTAHLDLPNRVALMRLLHQPGPPNRQGHPALDPRAGPGPASRRPRVAAARRRRPAYRHARGPGAERGLRGGLRAGGAGLRRGHRHLRAARAGRAGRAAGGGGGRRFLDAPGAGARGLPCPPPARLTGA
ncbi:MAG: hypothetical protein WKG07_00685 [Hymenobacter sp.]